MKITDITDRGLRVWAFVWARSEGEVDTQFPDLKVVPEWPRWLEGEVLSKIEAKLTFDIDNLVPDDWIYSFWRPPDQRGEPLR